MRLQAWKSNYSLHLSRFGFALIVMLSCVFLGLGLYFLLSDVPVEKIKFFSKPTATSLESKLISPTSQTIQQFTIAAVLPGSIHDGGWSQRIYEGLNILRTKYHAQLVFVENVSQESAEATIEKLAVAHPEMLVAYGGEYVNALQKIAARYPDISFMSTDSNGGNNYNLGSVYFDSSSTAFIAGVIAAVKTRSAKVAFVLGDRHPNTILDAQAFEAGVRSTRVGVASHIIWVGSWVDPFQAATAIRRQLIAGDDVFAVNTYRGDVAAIEAIAAAGAYTIAFHEDRHALAPKSVLTSILVDHSVILNFAAELIFEGRWDGLHHLLGVRDGAVKLTALNKDLLTPSEQLKIMDIWEKISEGETMYDLNRGGKL